MEPYNGSDSILSSYLNRVLTKLENTINQILYVPNNTPCFYARAGVAVVPAAVVTYTDKSFDTHNGLNITNGRYTVPRRGNYYFRYSQLVSVNGEYRVVFRKNGSDILGTTFITYRNGGWAHVHTEAHIQVKEGEVIEIYYQSGPANLYSDPDYGSFSGHMVGVTI